MKKLILNAVAAFVTVLGLGCIATASPVSATVICPDGGTANTLDGCTQYGSIEGKDTNLMDILGIIINVILGVVGFVAVFMIILGGISFVTSQGDAAKVTRARNTILYGVIGLVVAILAFAIVNFVLSSVFA